MAKKQSNEARMTLYRLVGLPSSDAAIREKYRDSEEAGYHYSHKTVSVADTEAVLYWGTVARDRASWTVTVNGLTKEDLKVGNVTSSAVLIIPEEDADEEEPEGESDASREPENDGSEKPLLSAWAITFGMGFQMLEQHYIDPGFGQRIAIRCATPDGLNALSKTTLDERPQMVRSTIPSGGSLRRFGFEELGDLVTRLVAEGHVEGIGDPKKPMKVRGADSLNIPLSKSPQTLLKNLDQIKTVLDKEPASRELAALEHLALVKDPVARERLDQSLIKAIGDKSDQVALSYPYEIIDDFGQVGSFKIIGTRQCEPYDYLPAIDDLLDPIREVDEDQRLKRLERLSVVLFKSSDETDVGSPKTPIKKWLTFQTTIDGKRYFLQNSRWYVMDSEYVKTVQQQVEGIFDRGTYFDDLPDWPIYEIPNDKDAQKKANAELEYNKVIAKQLNGLCLDQQLIRPKGSAAGIEACDVLLPHGVFVHVKHVSSSAPASHLLAQALVATDLLRTDVDAQRLLREKIEAVGGNPDDYETKPRRVVIVMAKNDDPITAKSLFTFTKINLVRHEQRLASMDVKLNIASVVRKKQSQ